MLRRLEGVEREYDALGRRTEKAVWRRGAQAYAWSGMQMVGERSDDRPDAARRIQRLGRTLRESGRNGWRGEQNLRFQGQYLDRETGLHYNTLRYYGAWGGC